MTEIPAPGKLIQEKCHEFESNRDYIAKPSIILNRHASKTLLKDESYTRVAIVDKSGDAIAEKS